MMVLAFCPKALWAKEVVHFADKDGNTVSFLLADHPAVTFDDENVIITTDVATVYYPLSAYSKFSMEADSETGISGTTVSGLVFSFTDGMSAEGLNPGNPVTIYSVSGQKLAQAVADSQGKVSLNVNAVKGRVYIVKTSTASFKFIK